MLEEIKQLEAELQKKKDVVIKDLLKQKEDIDNQLAELGYTKPKQIRKRKKNAS